MSKLYDFESFTDYCEHCAKRNAERLDVEPTLGEGAELAKSEFFIKQTLGIFCALVEEGTTPPRWLLEFVATGVRQRIADQKSWPTHNKRKADHPPIVLGLIRYIDEQHPGERLAIAEALLPDPDEGKAPSETTIGRYVKKNGREVRFHLMQFRERFDGKRVNLADLLNELPKVQAAARRAKTTQEHIERLITEGAKGGRGLG